MLSHERALRFPTSFPISGLVRLGVKPRLCRSSWRDLRRLIRSCFLLLLLGKLSLLALPHLLGICLPSLRSPPFPPHPLALISLYLAKVRFSLILTLSHLAIWYSGQTALFLILLAKAAWRTCQLLSLWQEATPFFSAGPVCSSFSAEACAILKAFCWSRQHQQVCHFSSPTLALSSPPYPPLRLSFYLNLSGRNCLLSPPVLSSYNGPPDARFSRGTTQLMSLPDGQRYLCHLQSLVVSLLLSLAFTFVFSRTGGVLCHLNSLTHRFPQFPLRNLCFLVTLDVPSLVSAAMETAYC